MHLMRIISHLDMASLEALERPILSSQIQIKNYEFNEGNIIFINDRLKPSKRIARHDKSLNEFDDH
jgi:hypothetical protein